MFDYSRLWDLCVEVDKLQAAGQVPTGKAYALMDTFSEYFSTVKPTVYQIAYSPVTLYEVVYYENGERQPVKGWVSGLPSYNKAAVVQWALIDAYKAGRHDKGDNDDVF